jgi:hypothetical protein
MLVGTLICTALIVGFAEGRRGTGPLRGVDQLPLVLGAAYIAGTRKLDRERLRWRRGPMDWALETGNYLPLAALVLLAMLALALLAMNYGYYAYYLSP